jgi:hypothetical protein
MDNNITNEEPKTKEVKKSTKDIYEKNLIRLNDGAPIKNYNFLKKTDVVLSKIDHLKDNSRRTYIISIVSTLKHLKGFEKIYKFYYDLMMQMNQDLKVNNSKSQTQSEQWIDQAEVLKIYDEVKAKAEPLLSLKKIGSKQWLEILDYIVLSLYVMIPPRRNADYLKMKYIKNIKNIQDKEDYKEYNYFIKDSHLFMFFNYKTSGTYQTQEVPVPSDLYNLLMKYIKIHPQRKSPEFFLLVNDKGEPFGNSNCITRILNKIFKKKIGVSMLRSVYLTDKFGNKEKEMQQTATDMGTSTNMISNNYVKFN